MSCPSWQWHRNGSRWSPVRTLPVAPLWCDLGFVPNSRGNKAAANLRPGYHPTRCPSPSRTVNSSWTSPCTSCQCAAAVTVPCHESTQFESECGGSGPGMAMPWWLGWPFKFDFTEVQWTSESFRRSQTARCQRLSFGVAGPGPGPVTGRPASRSCHAGGPGAGARGVDASHGHDNSNWGWDLGRQRIQPGRLGCAATMTLILSPVRP